MAVGWSHPIIVAGINVGGIRKGSHAVVFVMDYMATGFKRRMWLKSSAGVATRCRPRSSVSTPLVAGVRTTEPGRQNDSWSVRASGAFPHPLARWQLITPAIILAGCLTTSHCSMNLKRPTALLFITCIPKTAIMLRNLSWLCMWLPSNYWCQKRRKAIS